MSKRASDMMLLIKEALKLELPTFVLTQGSSAGDPTLQVAADATPATTEEVAFLKIVQRTYSGFPTPSLASAEDGRTHVLQLVVEESLVAGVSVWSSLDFARLLARLVEAKVHIELYIRATGAIPVEGDIIAGNLVGEIRADVRHPNMGN